VCVCVCVAQQFIGFDEPAFDSPRPAPDFFAYGRVTVATESRNVGDTFGGDLDRAFSIRMEQDDSV
jgi:hypothetical protein